MYKIILASSFFVTSLSFASITNKFVLTGEIVAIEKDQVRIKSGAQEFIFTKEELDHPSYAVGNKIEVDTDEATIKSKMVKKSKAK